MHGSGSIQASGSIHGSGSVQGSGIRSGGIGGVALYQHAVRKLLEARTRAERLAHLVARAAAVLEGERWKAEAGVQTPAGVPGLRTGTDGKANLAELPSGKDLLAALAEWREAWITVGKAWQALTPEGQVGLKDPKELY